MANYLPLNLLDKNIAVVSVVWLRQMPIEFLSKEGISKRKIGSYLKVLQDNIYAEQNSVVSEEELKMPPTEDDLIETAELLVDFEVNVQKIPKFKTLNELLKWRRLKIKEALD